MPLIFPTGIVVEIRGEILHESLVTLQKISISDEQVRNARNWRRNEVDINPSRNAVAFPLNNTFTLLYLFSPGFQLHRHLDRSELRILATLNASFVNG